MSTLTRSKVYQALKGCPFERIACKGQRSYSYGGHDPEKMMACQIEGNVF